MIRYYVCGIGYDENDCVTDYEKDFGDFDTYKEAYEVFVKLQCKDEKTFFEKAPEIYQLLVQLEECEEDDEEIDCIDVINEWWIINPNFQEGRNMNITTAVYDFHGNQVFVKVPFKIVKETEKCFFTAHSRYLKSEIGKPILKSTTSYPYISLVMVDADEETLRKGLSEWFTNKEYQIKEEI